MARAETELRHPEVRRALVDAGIASFLRGGFAASSVNDIVVAAGVPKGSFYYYFDSKSALACAAVERYAAADMPSRDALRHGEGAPLARLRAYFAGHAAAFEATGFRGGCLLGVLGLELAANDAAVSARVQYEIERWAAALAEAIEAARDAGEIAASQPAATLARVLISAWQGALIRMRLEQSAAPLREFQTIVLDSVLHAP